jgi:hypothetical protein
MQFLQDHLAAIIIAGVVIFLLAFAQVSGQEGAIDAVRFQAGRNSTDALGEFMAQDLANLGSGVAAGSARIHALTGTAPTTLFEFSGAVAPAATAVVERVRYRVVATDSLEVIISGETLELPGYELRREVLAAGTWRYTGGSASTLVDFRIDLLAANGTSVGAAHETARTARVRFVSASPLGGGRRAGVTRWERLIPLYNMGA